MVTASLVAAIGNFDGVHRGHQYLIAEAGALAREKGARAAALLFEPHPRRFFNPDAPPFLITTPRRRDTLLKEAGAARVVSLAFDRRLASFSPDEFVRRVLRKELGLAGVVAGADFRFGAKRAGDAAALGSLGEAAGLEVRIADLKEADGSAEKFSSSAVRSAIANGDMAGAARLLGRFWSVEGSVEQGAKIGRTLGFPTANLRLGPLIEPKRGVYATRARLDNGEAPRTYEAVSNFGRRPTIGDSDPLLETHLFDFKGDLYGETIDVEFVAFLREERKFDGLDALKAQISKDCEDARSALQTHAAR